MAGMQVHEARSWSEDELCWLILRVVSSGTTMQRLNEMTSGQVALTQSAFADTLRQFEIQAGQITAQEREIKRAGRRSRRSSRMAKPLSLRLRRSSSALGPR